MKKLFIGTQLNLLGVPLILTAFDMRGKRYLYKRGITIGNVSSLIRWIYIHLRDITHINAYNLKTGTYYGRIYPTYSDNEVYNILQQSASEEYPYGYNSEKGIL